MSEHLMVFPDRDDADRIAEDLRDEGFTEVRVVREALAGEDDSEDHEAQGLRERFAALAEEHDGWYDPDPATRA